MFIFAPFSNTILFINPLTVTNMIYKNNPLNLRFSDRNDWHGQISPLHGFCQFSNQKYGIRAALINMFHISQRLKTTNLKNVIYTWCPFGDGMNNPLLYTNFVFNYLHEHLPLEVDTTCIDFSSRLFMRNLIRAMCIVEQGSDREFDDLAFEKGYTMFFYKCLNTLNFK